MRTLRRNKQQMKYSLIIGEAPIYVTDSDGNIKYDSYTDSSGIEYRYPKETGETEIYYSTPVTFFGNISMSGSDSNFTEYGLSAAEYEAVLNLSRDEQPIVEGAIIWLNSEVESRYTEEIEVEIDGKIYRTIQPIQTSSDYTVIKRSTSLNEDRFILKAVNK